ncbi:FecR family protein [Dyadobacter sp. CY312]|uniref:FecR family protein n=1 Tax=Dyadobacter sp. CY312 TaxID=2907303 RepID=UPI001F3A98CE|nr:FecR domain-containing protein [Dyadobacter sp. CY312]MCE7044493.1 FecR domain-containing protein [Dyadobacter sp. CY312]
MKITAELLQKYAEGLCSTQERLAVEKWLDHSEAEVSFPAEQDLQVHKANIWQNIENDAHDYEPDRKPITTFWKPWLAAATVLLVCGLSLFLLRRPSKNQPRYTKTVTNIQYQTIKTSKGEKRAIKLSDGTDIYLNSDSEIRFPVPFSDTSRQVMLSGEAYFNVAKDKKRPFTVTTSQTSVRVLGTVFSLKSYSERITTLVVKEGKVQFASLLKNQKPLIITANQRGRFNMTSGMTKDNVYADRYLAWKDNRLVFDNESLTSVALTLERWYNIEMKKIPERIAMQHYTGEFEGKSLEYVLERMSYVMEFKYTINNKTVIIY